MQNQKALWCVHIASVSVLDRGQEFVRYSNGCLDLSTKVLISGMVFVRDIPQPVVASHLKGLHSFCAFSKSNLMGIQKYGYDKGVHQFQL